MLLDADEVNWGGTVGHRVILGVSRPFWGSRPFGDDLELFWGGLGPAQGTPKRFQGPFGRFQGSSEVPRTSFGGAWGQFGVFWAPLWAILGYFGPPPGHFGVF